MSPALRSCAVSWHEEGECPCRGHWGDRGGENQGSRVAEGIMKREGVVSGVESCRRPCGPVLRQSAGGVGRGCGRWVQEELFPRSLGGKPWAHSEAGFQKMPFPRNRSAGCLRELRGVAFVVARVERGLAIEEDEMVAAGVGNFTRKW